MDKCAWKDGKFKACLNGTGLFEQRNSIVGFQKDGGFYAHVKYCPFCGADICKAVQIPTHEDIMTNTWKCDDGISRKVNGFFDNGSGIIMYELIIGNYFAQKVEWRRVTKDWFIGRESADIPPE